MGFQFWRTRSIAVPGARAIVGGKLRVVPGFRNRGLHLLSGLAFFLSEQTRAPRTRFYRLSMASLFGFVSITEALARYHVFDPAARSGVDGAIRDAFVAVADESHYRLDPATGLFDVQIFVTPQTLGHYSPRYFAREAARVYASINPGWRTNGCYVGFWFRFTPANVLALARAIRRKLQRAG